MSNFLSEDEPVVGSDRNSGPRCRNCRFQVPLIRDGPGGLAILSAAGAPAFPCAGAPGIAVQTLAIRLSVMQVAGFLLSPV